MGGMGGTRDLWDSKRVAEYLGITQSTVRSYVARRVMPQPDLKLGGRWVWRAETIKEWHRNRPSRQQN